ncbi:MAG: type IIL restriction-modification enzyme MmeI, partial [Acidimicrobiales bacterium]
TSPEVGGVSDYVSYWFRKTHDLLPEGKRAGLVGTNTIRETDTRAASLDYILDNGGVITDAWSSIPWSGEAAVHVSIVDWIKGPYEGDATLWLEEGERRVTLPAITGSLSPNLDLRTAVSLRSNVKPKVFFQGQTPGHTKGFVLTGKRAEEFIERDPKSRDVIFPYIIGDELLNLGKPGRWVIDFPQADALAAKAAAPAVFEHLKETVLPDREAAALRESEANAEILKQNPKARVNWHHKRFLERWWQHSYRREEFFKAVSGLDRFIALAATASERRKPVFAFVANGIHPSHAVQCFAFDDDYSFGILQSSAHEAWFRGRCSTLEERLRYTATTVFDSFPWPQSPSKSAVNDVVSAVAEILTIRDELLNAGLSLAEQYNSLADPGQNNLRDAHESLDLAVLDAYGFGQTDDILADLLQLNLEVSAAEDAGSPVRPPGGGDLLDTRETDFKVPVPVVSLYSLPAPE